MNRHSKYTKKINRNRDCTKCRHYKGFISKNYFVCIAEMYEEQKELASHDIYDRDVLKKGACSLFVPIEAILYDDIHDNSTMDSSIEENDQAVSRKE